MSEKRYTAIYAYSLENLAEWWNKKGTSELTRQLAKSLIAKKDWKRLEELLYWNNVARESNAATTTGVSFPEVVEWLREN